MFASYPAGNYNSSRAPDGFMGPPVNSDLPVYLDLAPTELRFTDDYINIIMNLIVINIITTIRKYQIHRREWCATHIYYLFICNFLLAVF